MSFNEDAQKMLMKAKVQHQCDWQNIVMNCVSTKSTFLVQVVTDHSLLLFFDSCPKRVLLFQTHGIDPHVFIHSSFLHIRQSVVWPNFCCPFSPNVPIPTTSFVPMQLLSGNDHHGSAVILLSCRSVICCCCCC